MTPEQYKEFTEKFGKDAAVEMKSQMEAVEKKLNQSFEEKTKGMITEERFTELQKETVTKDLAEINKKLEQMEEASKEQGNKIAAALEKAAPNKIITLEQFITSQVPMLKELRSTGKMVEFTATQLKDAGITSIGAAGGSITDMTNPPGSPYLPGIGGAELEIFDIARNPSFILNHVDLGRTNLSRLAWINETEYLGAPAEVEEGDAKPLLQHKFTVEMSVAKKIAGWIKLTDEFDQDVPGLATRVRRMLQEDVARGWDDAIQAAVIAAAHQYEIGAFDDNIKDANYWDAILGMLAQVRYYNFQPNTTAINPLTNVVMKTWKDSEGRYLLPPFADEINSMLVQANKVVTGNALAGDLKQYKVDVYKEFVLKMGLVNDDLIKNQFTIVGEIRYHRYISEARKKALVYDSLKEVAGEMDGTQGS